MVGAAVAAVAVVAAVPVTPVPLGRFGFVETSVVCFLSSVMAVVVALAVVVVSDFSFDSVVIVDGDVVVDVVSLEEEEDVEGGSVVLVDDDCLIFLPSVAKLANMCSPFIFFGILSKQNNQLVRQPASASAIASEAVRQEADSREATLWPRTAVEILHVKSWHI